MTQEAYFKGEEKFSNQEQFFCCAKCGEDVCTTSSWYDKETKKQVHYNCLTDKP
jgi:hypothetical protein